MACDRKPACHKKILQTPQHSIQHYFKDLEHAICRQGPCILHPCQPVCRVIRKRPDCSVGGFSCKPFSIARGNLHAQPPHQHPDYELVHTDFFAYTDVAQQKGGIGEEVWGWDRPCPQRQLKKERCDVEGVRTYKDAWLHKLSQRGYSWSCVGLDNETWIDTPKGRCAFLCNFYELHFIFFHSL